MFDRWTLVHFAFWFVIGANYTWHGVPYLWAAIGTLVGALLWEVAETLLERYDLVVGKEKPINRWVSDILIAFVGSAAGMWWVL